MPSIQDFIAQMSKTHNFARTTRYRVEFQITNLFNKLAQTQNLSTGYDINWAEYFAEADANTTGRRLMMYCKETEIPGYSFVTDDNRHYGVTFKTPYMPSYADIEFQFYVGDDMFERWFFEGWMHSIMEPVTNDFNYVAEFSTSVDIYQVNQENENTYMCTLLEAYPTAINQLDLNYSDENGIHSLSVTFAYKRVVTTNQNISDLRSDNIRGRESGERFEETISTGDKPTATPSQTLANK